MRQRAKYAVIAYSHKTDMPTWRHRFKPNVAKSGLCHKMSGCRQSLSVMFAYCDYMPKAMTTLFSLKKPITSWFRVVFVR